MMFKKLIGIGIITAVGMVVGITDPALAQDKGLQETQDKGLVDQDPLRYSDEVKTQDKGLQDKGLVDRDPLRYSDEVKGMKQVLERPKPLLEWGQGYLRPGPYCCEFELPTGMVISPNLLIYGNFRTGPQAIENGVDPSSIAWVNTFDVFANLKLTGTERILFGMSPLTKKSGSKTRYVFQPDETLDTEFNARLTTAFFEGELSEMFPKLDWLGTKPLDWEIAVGRQPVFIHDGLLIQDTMDSVAITRSTVPLPGTQFARIGGIFGWDGVHRSNNKEDTEAYLLGLFSAMDVGHHTLDFDMVYVDSDQAQGDQLNIALGATQRIILFNTHFDTTFRIAGSLETDNETPISDDGALLFSSIAFAPPTTDPWDNIAYVNLFLALDNYKAASRKSGGPLGLTGLLFAGNGLASFTPISNQANESYGGAIGYQMFFSPKQRTNLIMEIAGRRDDSPTGFNAYGIGAKISQAIGQHTFVSLDVFGINQEGKHRDTRHGLRSELNIIF